MINFDPPRTDDDYVHRIGRTGRAGRAGTGLTLVLPEQQVDVGRLADKLGHGAAFAASGMRPAPASVERTSSRRRRPRSVSRCSSKRSPQTAAKRAREQQVREKRERKAAKKLARKDGTYENGVLAGEPRDGEEPENGTTVTGNEAPLATEQDPAEPGSTPVAGELPNAATDAWSHVQVGLGGPSSGHQ